MDAKAEPLIDYITREHGTQRAYAEHIGKKPQEVNRWIAKDYWMINGELYGPVKRTKVESHKERSR